MQPRKAEHTQEYRAQINLPNSQVMITSSDRVQIQDLVTNCVRASYGTPPMFEGNGDTAVDVYHPRWAEGKEPCGVINIISVSRGFSVHRAIDLRKQDYEQRADNEQTRQVA